jgi:hypothetical protein
MFRLVPIVIISCRRTMAAYSKILGYTPRPLYSVAFLSESKHESRRDYVGPINILMLSVVSYCCTTATGLKPNCG